MYIINGKRGEGKTARLLACANDEKGIAVVLNKAYAKQLAKSMNINNLVLLGYKDFLYLYHYFEDELSSGKMSFFIDELPILLDIFNIHIEANEIYDPLVLPALFENQFPTIKLKGYSYTHE